MKVEYLFFLVYFFLVFWCIPRINFIKRTNLSVLEIRLLLAFKVFTGFLCAYYFLYLSSNMDYLASNTEGLLQYRQLLSTPSLFFDDLTHDIKLYGFGRLFASENSFWAYLRFNLLYKFIALLNFLSAGNFYLNSMIFSSLVFWGHIAMYNIFIAIYKGRKYAVLFTCFCLPSLLLYTACIHKDGIVFLCIAIVSYVLFQLLSERSALRLKSIILFLIGMSGIFLFRNYVLLAVMPAIAAAILCHWMPFKKRLILATTYTVFCAFFFLSGNSNSSLNLPAAVVQRKADFAALTKGNTDIPMNELKPTFQSFVVNLPCAIDHSFLRPYLWEFPQISIMLTALELFLYQLIFLVFIFWRKKESSPIHPFNIFGLSFLLNIMLIIGYTIPNVGAIVRYRSAFWVFLITPLLCNIDWKRLTTIFKPAAARQSAQGN